MHVIRGLDQYPPDAPPSVVAQGTFDGIHLGHQAVIRTAVERARALGVRPVALTFDPLPVAVLRPAEAPPEILSLDERLEHIAALGPEVALVIPFTLEFSRVEADAFVRDVLAGLLRAREVVVGFNHTFGRGAAGTPEMLQTLGSALGIRVHIVSPLTVDSVLVSSSSVREALRQGDVRRAAALLGRLYTVRAPVARGAMRGRDLGFPTANLTPAPTWLLASGVYAGRAAWNGQSAAAVINIGVRPTFADSALVIEAHLLDTKVDLYDRLLTLAFVARVRDERKFASVEALRAQISEDVAAARALLARQP
jgi:riboflavin kinase/FMN adenylyltransferase